MKKSKNEVDNKYEFGLAFIDQLVKHWFKIVSLIILIGAIAFMLQLKTFKCGDAEITKEPMKTPLKK